MTDTLAVKLAKVEQKVTDQGLKIDEIYMDVKEIKSCISNGNFDKRLIRLENKSNFWQFLNPTLSAIIASLGTFLLINYLQNLR